MTRHVLTGTRVGRVPPGAGTPPLVRDTLERLRALRIDTDGAEPRNLALDLYRNPAHRRTSRTLHGLRLLAVPFAEHTAGPDFVRGTGLARLQERWTYLWSPGSEGRLAEASLLGSTLPEAVEARFAQLLARGDRGGPGTRAARRPSHCWPKGRCSASTNASHRSCGWSATRWPTRPRSWWPSRRQARSRCWRRAVSRWRPAGCTGSPTWWRRRTPGACISGPSSGRRATA